MGVGWEYIVASATQTILQTLFYVLYKERKPLSNFRIHSLKPIATKTPQSSLKINALGKKPTSTLKYYLKKF